MDGRAFLGIARELMLGGSEPHWRAAAGRAYYALMLEGREALRAWGFVLPPRDQVHAFVRLRFTYAADPDAKSIGWDLDRLVQLRNHADYDLSAPQFATDGRAQDSINRAARALALLDAIAGDPVRRAAVVADIQARWP